MDNHGGQQPASAAQQQKDAEPNSQRQPRRQQQQQRKQQSKGKGKQQQQTKTKGPKRQVDLFSHLKQLERGRPITEDLSLEQRQKLPEPILKLGVQIANGKIVGSGERCLKLLLVLKEVFRDYYETPEKELPQRHMIAFLNPLVDFLVRCRPLAYTMSCAIRYVKRVILEKMPVETQQDEAIEFVCKKIDNFITDRILKAHDSIIEHACAKIEEKDVVVIFGVSTLITRVLKKAARRKMKFEVVVIDSHPYHPGREQLKRLSKCNITCKLTMLAHAAYWIRRAQKVLLSAHSVMGNGNVVSTAGTSMIANAAKYFNVPVLVCCEAYKFSADAQMDSFVHNELCDPDDLLDLPYGKVSPLQNWMDIPSIKLLNLDRDVTLAEDVDVIITDYGYNPPSSSGAVLRKCESKLDAA